LKRKRFTEGQIIRVLDELKQGIPLLQLARKYGVTDWTIYRWKHKYGQMSESEVRRLKQLEEENARLKRIVAQLTIDNDLLKELNLKKW
jgi:putative transposase